VPERYVTADHCIIKATEAFRDHLKEVSTSSSLERALSHLIQAAVFMSEDSKARSAFAHRLIAENMFAIVRLEIGQATDQIITIALEAKRFRTGSKAGAASLNAAGTMAMLAGNILSAGSLDLLGKLLVASGEIVQAAAGKDLSGIATGLLHMSTGAVEASGGELATQNSGGWQAEGTVDVTTTGGASKAITATKAQTRTAVAETVGDTVIAEMTKLLTEPPEPPPDGYQPRKEKTAFISHGAGGTAAITFDVQESMEDAYSGGVKQISTELAKLGGKAPEKLLRGELYDHEFESGSILATIMSKDQATEMKNTLHPMTDWVLEKALSSLALVGGTNYQLLEGGSGRFGRASTLRHAKRFIVEQTFVE